MIVSSGRRHGALPPPVRFLENRTGSFFLIPGWGMTI
jgi:hypothetical protein